MSVYEREKKDLAKGKKSGQRGENVTGTRRDTCRNSIELDANHR
jgi:hypothetical protein